MSDRERLEEIKVKYSILTVSSEKNGIEYTKVDVEDLMFLIQNGFKQADRVEELEMKLSINTNNMKQLQKENECYKQRVEELEKEKDEWKDTAQSYYMTNQELREQNKRYRKAINNIIEKVMLFGTNEEVYETIQDAIKALEGME